VNAGIPCFGPRKQAAMIESSKEFAKQFMSRFNLPTAKWKAFTDAREACDFIRRLHCRFFLSCFCDVANVSSHTNLICLTVVSQVSTR